MAPRPEVEEVFTDLRGNPDPAPAADDAAELERGLIALASPKDKIEDADLQVDDELEADSEDDAESGADADADEDADENEEAEQDPPSDFDPKDVVILTKDAELLETREKHLTAAQATAKADIAAAEAEMERAQEAGETKANIEATKKYTAATIALQTSTQDLAQVAQDKQVLTARAKELYAKAPKDAEGKAILTGESPAARAAARKKESDDRPSKLTPKFKAANPWFGNAKYATQAKTLMAIDKGLAAEGLLNKDTPEYFAEMGKRFNAKHPGLFKNIDGKPVATGARRRGTGTPIPSAGSGVERRQGQDATKIKLTTADLVQMRQFGMDPDKPEHRRTWLGEKRQQAGAR